MGYPVAYKSGYTEIFVLDHQSINGLKGTVVNRGSPLLMQGHLNNAYIPFKVESARRMIMILSIRHTLFYIGLRSMILKPNVSFTIIEKKEKYQN